MSARWRVAAFLAALFVPTAVSTAFLPLWLAHQGLTAAALGEVLALTSFLRLGGVVAWGELADRVGRRRPVLLAGSALAAFGAVLMWPAYGFWPMLAASAFQGIAASALLPLADTLTLALAADRRLVYAPVRAWGSIAFMAATAASGPLIGYCGVVAIPWLMVGGFAAATGIAAALPEATAPPRAPSAAGGVRLLRHRPFLLTVAASALIQGSHAAYYALGSLHWRAHGISDTAIGLLWAEGVVSETLLFLFGTRLIRRLGPAGLTAMAASAALVRWTVTGLTTALPLLATVQVLHGATFGMQHLSAMLMLSRTVPPDRAATAQTLHAALGPGLATGALIWLVGGLYTGSGAVFFLMAALGGAGLLAVPGLARATRPS